MEITDDLFFFLSIFLFFYFNFPAGNLLHLLRPRDVLYPSREWGLSFVRGSLNVPFILGRVRVAGGMIA